MQLSSRRFRSENYVAGLEGMALEEHLNALNSCADYLRQRRSPRYQVQCRLRVTLPSYKGSRCFHTRGEDVSESGMAMFIATELEVGEIVQLDFVLPHSPWKLLVKATVRNRTGFRYGVEFTRTNDHERQAIAATCRVLELLQ
jgi:hypothetical protein